MIMVLQEKFFNLDEKSLDIYLEKLEAFNTEVAFNLIKGPAV